MGAQVVYNHDGQTSLGARTGNRRPHLGTKDLRRAAGGEAPVKPPVAPVDEPKAIDFVIGPWSFHQALSSAAFATPHAGQRRMEGELDLVLEIDIGVWEEGQELFHIGRHVSEQIGFDQFGHGWRGRWCRPQPIPPPPLGVSHVGRLRFGFVFERPGRTLTDIVGGSQR